MGKFETQEGDFKAWKRGNRLPTWSAIKLNQEVGHEGDLYSEGACGEESGVGLAVRLFEKAIWEVDASARYMHYKKEKRKPSSQGCIIGGLSLPCFPELSPGASACLTGYTGRPSGIEDGFGVSALPFLKDPQRPLKSPPMSLSSVPPEN
ncbi:hypothetical protein HJG60_011033 [Phyllostomus discolor]|uniref:Uncharacterized protein n=1 Tax=Phyllostomus discolor TaxID=89673 RepID=A0A834A7I2_9CHIR|nr:hypothetical protein HJG60_011033 [Phyllostomus discolor]